MHHRARRARGSADRAGSWPDRRALRRRRRSWRARVPNSCDLGQQHQRRLRAGQARDILGATQIASAASPVDELRASRRARAAGGRARRASGDHFAPPGRIGREQHAPVVALEEARVSGASGSVARASSWKLRRQQAGVEVVRRSRLARAVRPPKRSRYTRACALQRALRSSAIRCRSPRARAAGARCRAGDLLVARADGFPGRARAPPRARIGGEHQARPAGSR